LDLDCTIELMIAHEFIGYLSAGLCAGPPGPQKLEPIRNEHHEFAEQVRSAMY
jgi:hypothetical protein